MTEAFRSWAISSPPTFAELASSVRFDDVTTGRRGAVVVRPDERGAPIVRTTTSYRAAPQRFGPLHERLAQEIRAVASLAQPFNNALVEHYTTAYAKMKRHSDQALDLAEGSSIAVFSCYRDPARPSRRLVVQPKGPGDGFEMPLEHGGVVTFSLATNRLFTHAIVLRESAPDTDWFGLTFRTSRTFVRFGDGGPLLPSGAPLVLASEDQRRDLFQMRRRENEETDFTYPAISYTLSESDLRPPE